MKSITFLFPVGIVLCTIVAGKSLSVQPGSKNSREAFIEFEIDLFEIDTSSSSDSAAAYKKSGSEKVPVLESAETMPGSSYRSPGSPTDPGSNQLYVNPVGSTNSGSVPPTSVINYLPRNIYSVPAASPHSQSYSTGPQQYITRPVTYVPPQITFHPPKIIVTKSGVTFAQSQPPYDQKFVPHNEYSQRGQFMPLTVQAPAPLPQLQRNVAVLQGAASNRIPVVLVYPPQRRF